MIKCTDCKAWLEVDFSYYKGFKTGECRRVSAKLSPKGDGVWPITKEGDGCFDGIQKEEEMINE